MIKTFYAELNRFSEDEIRSLLPHISEERRLFAQRLKSFARFKETVAAEALARHALSLECGIPGRKLAFERTESGKPRQTTVQGLYFNVSHSGNIVFCGISDRELGVDTERYGRVKEGMVKNILSPAELLEYEGLEGKRKETFPAYIWCRKESYYKMLGSGITGRLSGTDTGSLEKNFGICWTDGFLGDESLYSVCQKKPDFSLDKTDQITQPTLILDFVL